MATGMLGENGGFMNLRKKQKHAPSWVRACCAML